MFYTNDLSALNAHPYPFSGSKYDLNTDGAADLADAVLLCRILAEDADDTVLNLTAADCDGDGVLTLLDLRFLLHEILIA